MIRMLIWLSQPPSASVAQALLLTVIFLLSILQSLIAKYVINHSLILHALRRQSRFSNLLFQLFLCWLIV